MAEEVICLESIGDNKFKVIDCDSGKPIELGKGGKKKKRKKTWYNVCISEQFKRDDVKSLSEAAPLCKGRKEEYKDKV